MVQFYPLNSPFPSPNNKDISFELISLMYSYVRYIRVFPLIEVVIKLLYWWGNVKRGEEYMRKSGW